MAAQRVCLVSGGTGGHLMPALVLARTMQEAGYEPVLVTEGRDVERELLRRELPDVASIELPRPRPHRFALPLWLPRATMAARRVLRQQQIQAVLSTGGRASVPVALAARSLGLPLFLLEQNAVTGRANRWLSPLARRIYLGLPGSTQAHARALLTGTPLRPGFATVERAAARKSLGLRPDVPVVLVTGGSQGARVLNERVPAALLRVGVALQVLHLSGLGNDAEVRHRYAGAPRDTVAHVRPVAADMDRLFAAADLVVCRGGGTTVAELAAVGRPAILVPYPHHRDRQQWHNARVLERVGAGIVIEEHQLEETALAELLSALLVDPQRLETMGEAGRAVGRRDAAAAILSDVRTALAQPAAARSGATAGPGPATGALLDGERGERAVGVDAPARRGGVA